MSAAIRAKSARARANIACRFIRAGSTSGRAFSDCFEMGDGDEVLTIIIERAKRDTALLERVRKVFDAGTLKRLGL